MCIESVFSDEFFWATWSNGTGHPQKLSSHICSQLLPPQGFRPEAKSRGGTLVARAYIKDSTYSTNMQSVYRKNLDLLEQGPRGIGR